MIIKSEIDRAWLACFLDTDGSIYLRRYLSQKRPYAYVMVMFFNSNKDIIDKVASLIPGRIHFHYREGIDLRGIKRGNNYTFTVQRKILKELLKELLPHLVVKKEKTSAFLEDWNKEVMCKYGQQHNLIFLYHMRESHRGNEYLF